MAINFKQLIKKRKKRILKIIKRGSDISGLISVITILFGVSVTVAIPTSTAFLLVGIGISFLIDAIPDTIEEIKQIINKFDENDISSLITMKDEIESKITLSTTRSHSTLHLPY